MTQAARQTVGIFVFDDVEVLDFAGPFEVFSRTRLEPGLASRRTDDNAPLNVFTVAAKAELVTATGGLRIMPHCCFADAPPIDILVVSGGWGTRRLVNDEATIEWITGVASRATLVTSVCTGALLLARAGLLAGRRATTHWGGFDALKAIDQTIEIDPNARFVVDGPITSAGVSAGLDMALSIVERLFGAAVAEDTAHYIEYRGREGLTATVPPK